MGQRREVVLGPALRQVMRVITRPGSVVFPGVEGGVVSKPPPFARWLGSPVGGIAPQAALAPLLNHPGSACRKHRCSRTLRFPSPEAVRSRTFHPAARTCPDPVKGQAHGCSWLGSLVLPNARTPRRPTPSHPEASVDLETSLRMGSADYKRAPTQQDKLHGFLERISAESGASVWAACESFSEKDSDARP